MDTSDAMTPQAWINALARGELDPNLMDTGNDTKYQRAWVKQYESEYYVVYEEGLFDSVTRTLMGSLAVADVEDASHQERDNRLLDSAMTPLNDRKYFASSLEALMGVKSDPRPALPKPAEETSHNRVFINEMSSLTGVDHGTIIELGLQNFQNRPFKSRADKTVYLISRLDLDDEWPALKYHLPQRRWGHRLLQSYEVLSIGGFADKEHKASLIRGSGWIPISHDNIVRICDKLGERQPVNSL